MDKFDLFKFDESFVAGVAIKKKAPKDTDVYKDGMTYGELKKLMQR